MRQREREEDPEKTQQEKIRNTGAHRVAYEVLPLGPCDCTLT